MISNKIENKVIESDYHDGDTNPPHVSWVPIISRRSEKIKEVFDVIAKSEGTESDYIKKLNRIAEMLNVTYDIENENFSKIKKNNLENVKSYKKKYIEKSELEKYRNNAFSINVILSTKISIYLYSCLLFFTFLLF
ncbi:Hypothetical protein SRAE_1000179700 [Strongyloides ratti]|uniref:Uncharacterized protein n=1 Tax=Strongyloides ratti TaxID=34506 RepID=A0A090L1G1_STRRB|nr:Hypothetical protein SRAE_1000179700 [Strongyloides ratti]CEF63536.1 Hypothetical protein SRAE_1000179700 [Strongyloides ratti]